MPLNNCLLWNTRHFYKFSHTFFFFALKWKYNKSNGQTIKCCNLLITLAMTQPMRNQLVFNATIMTKANISWYMWNLFFWYTHDLMKLKDNTYPLHLREWPGVIYKHCVHTKWAFKYAYAIFQAHFEIYWK